MEGQTISRLEIQQQKGASHPEIIIHLSNGASFMVMSDEEGNDNGALHMLVPPLFTTTTPQFSSVGPGLMPSDQEMIGKKYASRGRTYTITGFAPNRPKNPVQLLRDDGKKFKCGIGMARTMVKMAPAQ